MQPRQSRGQLVPRRSSGSARPAAAAAARAGAKATPRPKEEEESFLDKLDRGILGEDVTESSDDGGTGQLAVIKKVVKAKGRKRKSVMKWHLGYIYAIFGIVDIGARVTGLYLWRYRYNTTELPRVSDTQREDIFTGVPTEKADFLRLVFTGANSIARCLANLIILWNAFADLRPAWGLRLMRWITPCFRVLLVLWVFADIMQAFIPEPPPDPTNHQITTVHIFFAQMTILACGPAYFMLLVVMFFDLDAGRPSLVAGMFTSVVMTFSYVYHTEYLFRAMPGKSTPMLWAIVTEVSFLTFNVGMAMPYRIIAMPGDLGKKWYQPKFLREGKVRVYEDTSARTGAKPLLFTGEQHADEALAEEENEFLQRQQEELNAMNEQFRSLFGDVFDAYDAPTEEEKAAEAGTSLRDEELGDAERGTAAPAVAAEDDDSEPEI